MKVSLISDAEDHITEAAVAASATNVVPVGTVLAVTRSGILRRTFPIAVTTAEVAINQDLKALKPVNGIDPKYIAWYLRSDEQSILHDCSKDGTTVDSIDFPALLKREIPIAPYAEQERIVAVIEEQFSLLDTGMEALQSARRKLKRMRAAVLQVAVMGRQHSSYSVDSESDLPSSWRWVQLETILADGRDAFRRGPFGSALTKASFVDKGYKVYEQYCPINDDCTFGRYYISAQRYEELKGFAVQAGDFLVSCSGTLGRITQAPEDFEPGVINQALLRIRTNKQAILDDYFLALFRSPYFQQQVLDNSTGTAMANVKGVRELKAIPIPLPPLAEQHEILNRLATFESVESALDYNLERCEQRAVRLRASTLAAAFSGRLASQDPTDEPASDLLSRIATERAQVNRMRSSRTRRLHARQEKLWV
jgi:type I restriction enzyme S subunit